MVSCVERPSRTRHDNRKRSDEVAGGGGTGAATKVNWRFPILEQLSPIEVSPTGSAGVQASFQAVKVHLFRTNDDASSRDFVSLIGSEEYVLCQP
jgi:hypothetical protein